MKPTTCTVILSLAALTSALPVAQPEPEAVEKSITVHEDVILPKRAPAVVNSDPVKRARVARLQENRRRDNDTNYGSYTTYGSYGGGNSGQPGYVSYGKYQEGTEGDEANYGQYGNYGSYKKN